jgi:hypothetical protein
VATRRQPRYLRLLKQRGVDPGRGSASPVLLLVADVLRVSPGRGRTRVRPCHPRGAGQVIGDHVERQFEGQIPPGRARLSRAQLT